MALGEMPGPPTLAKERWLVDASLLPKHRLGRQVQPGLRWLLHDVP